MCWPTPTKLFWCFYSQGEKKVSGSDDETKTLQLLQPQLQALQSNDRTNPFKLSVIPIYKEMDTKLSL